MSRKQIFTLPCRIKNISLIYFRKVAIAQFLHTEFFPACTLTFITWTGDQISVTLDHRAHVTINNTDTLVDKINL